ncbi:MAG: hypothetical protein PHO37_15275 [Kiritimatiellae bacterium]|nr:hypothetical protein [Kiritimatiellia bacterium]
MQTKSPTPSGFWDDPTKWYGSVVPQDIESVEVFGIGDPTYAKQVTVTYRNTYDPGAVFNGLLLGSGFTDIRFILQYPFTSSGNIGVQDHTVF